MKAYSLIVFVTIVFSSCKNNEIKEGKIIKPDTKIEESDGVLPFAEDIFSQYTNVRDFTVNSDENEAYFTLQSPARELSVIMKMRKENNK
jgi:hypothetical protein